MCIDVKAPLSKGTGHTTSTFQNYRLENKLLQELGDEIFIIISNTGLFNQKSVLLLNSSGGSASTGICYHHYKETHYCLSFTLL